MKERRLHTRKADDDLRGVESGGGCRLVQPARREGRHDTRSLLEEALRAEKDAAGRGRCGGGQRAQRATGDRADAQAVVMGGTPHWRRGHLAGLQAAAKTGAAERDRCAHIVERWNDRPTHDWSPAIGTALKAGYRWLDVYCGGCRQVKSIDLASVDIHPQACLTSLILLLRCRQCGGHGPLPKLIGLSCFPAVALKSGS
jgi:hypothetical protein